MGTWTSSHARKPWAEPQAFVSELSFMAPLVSRQEHIIPDVVAAILEQFSAELLEVMSATKLPPKT
ncbi:hypothetical protein N7532_011842 [Penicillium argentinense]|uniref:Uncharacterized protein n=1 Tax=Penicillium argentinense TaxID=1131581 RepID=A0A9W9JUY8_9EURO|nr:uncharacterized protein N7532_011842 [Penicillium argentinense]KAJ5082799.1 hypothetical protein N7532_011842 [Penicillium argentinense]